MDVFLHAAVEARKWLRDNPGDSVLAANRFGETGNAVAFVEALYAHGATEVLVEEPHLDAAGEPYGDTLLVKFLPGTGTQWALQRFCEAEGRGDLPVGDFVMRVGDAEIRLWWD